MFMMVLRKMINNKWMVLCLLVGFILAVAMVSSIPIYTDGVLQRMLTRDLENHQISSGFYPGRFHATANIYSNYAQESRLKAFHLFDDRLTKTVPEEIGLPVKAYTRNISVEYLNAVPEVQREEKPIKRSMNLQTLHGLEDHAKLINGRMFSSEKDGDIYEVIVNEQTMKKMDLRLDEVYLLEDFVKRIEHPLKVKLVGIFTINDPEDPYWFQGLNAYNSSFLMEESLFLKEFIEGELSLTTRAQWYYAFDYHKINLDNTPNILAAHKEQERWFSERRVEFKMPAVSVLEKYYEREMQLKTTLWVVQVPILMMLGFYLLMVSQLTVGQERNEIAVMKSRGASSFQVFLGYLMESGILGGIALLAGPPLGLLICKFLGSANGFLEFVQRTALPISLNSKAYIYSLGAVLLSMITMLIPAFIASRATIVEYKREKARTTDTPIWQKYFLDILLLAISAYGLYSYNLRQQTLEVTGAEGTQLAIDPMLFIISTLFILGAGLILLRIYPYIVRLLFLAGKRIWSPALYASFVQVGRAGGQDRSLMLFLILTLSIGIFNANAARTLNNNIEEKIKYTNGADLNVMSLWESNEASLAAAGGGPPGMGGPPESTISSLSSREPVQYKEPPFIPFTELEGIDMATKVFRQKEIVVQTPARERTSNKTQLLGIIPDEFGKTAWFRDDLLGAHWHSYLNLMSVGDPRAALVTKDFKEEYEIEKGDSLWLSWGDQGYLEIIVYEFIDYWPTFNPNQKEGEKKPGSLVVAQLDYIQANNALEPYEVWLKKGPDVTSQQIYDEIENKGIKVEEMTDTSQEIIKAKNDPMLQGTNGALTLGFVVTMSVSTIGFLIYWILSIRQRVLQFGIFRAMGLSVSKIMGLLAWEQLLISGTAIFIGIVVGGLTSDLFVPLLQIIYSAADQVPPFKVMASGQDYIKIYSVVVLMLVVGISALGILVSRIKIHQAIKLGED
ncbi:MAG TPA: FtsX-like permease family protein [Clostridia bacterium]|nr:FtsX-like permease family protein [Clostridia bacterium]